MCCMARVVSKCFVLVEYIAIGDHLPTCIMHVSGAPSNEARGFPGRPLTRDTCPDIFRGTGHKIYIKQKGRVEVTKGEKAWSVYYS